VKAQIAQIKEKPRKVDPVWAERLRTMPATPPRSPSPAPPDPGWRILLWGGLLVIPLVWTGAMWALASTADDSWEAVGVAFLWIVGMGVWTIALVIAAIATIAWRAVGRRRERQGL
jgi:hypothetical protein